VNRIGLLLAVLGFGFFSPRIAVAGTGYLSTWVVSPSGTSQGLLWSGVHVTNISSDYQTVTITLYQVSGAPLANYTLMVNPGTLPPGQTINMDTDQNGTITIRDLPARTMLAVAIPPLGSGTLAGWGIISGATAKTLVADGEMWTPSWPVSSFMSVNGGNPF